MITIYISSLFYLLVSWADPGFFLGGGVPLRNDVTERGGKQILKANTKKKASSQGGWGAHPLHPPPRSALGFTRFFHSDEPSAQNHFPDQYINVYLQF